MLVSSQVLRLCFWKWGFQAWKDVKAIFKCDWWKTFQIQAREFIVDYLPGWLKPLEKLLEAEGNPWYSGNSPTFADLAIMVVLDFIHRDYMTFKGLTNLEERKAILDKFPMVKANYERTSSLPAVLSWKKKKPTFAGL